MNNEQLLEKIGAFMRPLVDGIAHLKTAVETLKAGQDDIREKMEGLGERVEILEAGQQRIEQKLDTTIEDHEERITHLEAADSHSHHATQACA